MSETLVTVVSVLSIIINLGVIAFGIRGIINTHREYQKSKMKFLRSGIKMGRDFRRLDIEVPENMFDKDPLMYNRGFMHSYIATGQRIARGKE